MSEYTIVFSGIKSEAIKYCLVNNEHSNVNEMLRLVNTEHCGVNEMLRLVNIAHPSDVETLLNVFA